MCFLLSAFPDQFLTSSDIVMVEDDDEERGNDNAMQDVVAPPYNLNDVCEYLKTKARTRLS